MNGLDKHIDSTIQLLIEKLWLPYNNRYVGHSWILNKGGVKQPYIYDGSNEYDGVLGTDKSDSLVHFYVLPDREKIGTGTYKSQVYIMFAVNLGAIYGNDTRAVEKALFDANEVIKLSPFDIQDITTDIESYDVFDLTPKQTDTFNMQPFYVFRFETEIIYSLNVSCPPTETTDRFDVNTSIVGNGIINSNPTTLTNILKNTLVSLNATADINNKFVSWVVDGATSTNRVVSFYITKTVDAIATFITSLITIQDVFTTAPEIIDNEWKFIDQVVGIRKDLNVLCYGNSVTKGTYGAPTTDPYPIILNGLLLSGDDVVNLGLDAKSGLFLLENYHTYITPNLSSTKRNVLVVWELVNDIPDGATPQEAYEHIRDICLLAKTQGLVVVVGTYNIVDNAYTTEYAEASQLIVDNWESFSDYIHRIDLITEWQNPAIYTNDGVHPYDYNPLADLVYSIVNDITTGNNVKITSPAAKFVIDTHTGINIVNSFTYPSAYDFKFKSIFYLDSAFNTYEALLYENNNKGFIILMQNVPSPAGFKTRILIETLNGLEFKDITTLSRDSLHTLEIEKTGLNVDIISDGVTTIMTLTAETLGQTVSNITLLSNPTQGALTSFNGILGYARFEMNGVKQYEYGFEEQNGDVFYDMSSFKRDGTLNSGVVDRTVTKTTEPFNYTRGVEVYKHDTLVKYINVPLNDSGEQNLTITDYTKRATYNPASGILLGLSNTYKGILHDDWELNDKTFNDINNEPNSDTYIKTGSVSQLIVKA